MFTGETITYSYNALGQVTSYTEKQNNSTKVKQTCVYDAYGNISQEKLSGRVSQTYSYSYDDMSDRRFNGMTFGGVTEEITYDDLDRIATKQLIFNGKEVYTKSYEYYKVGAPTLWYATTWLQSIKYEKGGKTKSR